MEKNSQRKRAFLAAIAMILVAAIVLSTATFAWFTLGRSAQVEELDLKVTKQGEGIAISANSVKFTDTITYANLTATAEDDESAYNAKSEDYNYFCERITPASSEFKLNTLPVFFQGGIDKVADTMIATAATSADGETIYGKNGNEVPDDGVKAGFYQFDVFIQNGGTENVTVKMTGSKIIVNEKIAEQDSHYNDKDKQGNYIDRGNADYYDETVKAMRIGFVNCGTVVDSTGEAQTPTAVTPVAIFAASKNWDKNDTEVAIESAAASTNPIRGAGESAVLHNADDKSEIWTVPKDKAGTIEIADEYGVPVIDNSTTGTDGTMTLEPGVTKVTVYIWMEGQDANCTDNLMSQYIKANVVFSLV